MAPLLYEYACIQVSVYAGLLFKYWLQFHLQGNKQARDKVKLVLCPCFLPQILQEIHYRTDLSLEYLETGAWTLITCKTSSGLFSNKYSTIPEL